MKSYAILAAAVGFLGSMAQAEQEIVVPETGSGSAEGVVFVLLVVGALYFLSGQSGAAKTTRPAPAPEADSDVIMEF